VLTLRPRPPLDFHRTLERYHHWGPDPASVFADAAFYRVARVGYPPGGCTLIPFRVRAVGSVTRPALTVTFRGPDMPEVRAALRAQVRRLLGLDADLPGFYRTARRDPVLAPLVSALYGLRPSVVPDALEMLVGAIAAQQVNLAFAFRIRARLVEQFGERVDWDGVRVYAFPAAATLAAADEGTLRSMQFSRRKAEYVLGLARQVAAGTLDLQALAALPDDEIVRQLTRVRGLGGWTAEWFLVRGLGRPDVCPADDLGVRRAFEAHGSGGRGATADGIRRRARAWRPYRSLAVHYLLAAQRLVRRDGARGAAPRKAERP
jgi:DNA-3-methyladenine glycosylase II